MKLTIYERAKAYAKEVPPAISGQGGHNQTYHLACELVWGFGLHDNEAYDILRDWNATCQPPWSEYELRRKIDQASKASHDKPRGHRIESVTGNKTITSGKQIKLVKSSAQSQASIVQGLTGLPPAIPNGCVKLLELAFDAGEGIAISEAVLNDEGRGIPAGQGLVLSREEWLKKLNARDGDPNRLWSSSDNPGAYIRVNPMKVGGSKDDDVTAYRHALLEFDSGASLGEQYALIQQSELPCTAIVYSGGKSIHAWVRVDAKDRLEYAERVKRLLDYFEQYRPDTKNKNPSRFARLPGMKRGNQVQDLLAVHTGAQSWSTWEARQSDVGSEIITVKDLINFNPALDPNQLLGRRWLCKGQSCIIMGPSGIGKSTLTTQLAVWWAAGLAPFGLRPNKPLKSLIVQAENDIGDLSEQLQGACLANSALRTAEGAQLLHSNLVFVRDQIRTGHEFVSRLQTLIDRYKPDCVWIDPLLAFIGGDLGDQEVASTFLRNWLGPVLETTGCVLFLVHHIRKPSQTDVERNSTELQYMAAGSSELNNWARASIYLEAVGDSQYRLRFLKRGQRAEAIDAAGKPSVALWVRHSAVGQAWEVCEGREPEKVQPKSSQTHSTPRPKIVMKQPKFDIDAWLAEFQEGTTYLEHIRGLTDGGWSEARAKDLWTHQIKPHLNGIKSPDEAQRRYWRKQ